MVNSNSTIFIYSEKIGILIGKGIRYILVGGFIIFIGGKLASSKPVQQHTNNVL